MRRYLILINIYIYNIICTCIRTIWYTYAGAVVTAASRRSKHNMIICYTIIIIYIILLVVVVVHAEEKEMCVPIPSCTCIYVKVFPSILFFASSRPDPERSLSSDILLLLLLCDSATRQRFQAGLLGSRLAVEIILCI
jgi:hypothetical protein